MNHQLNAVQRKFALAMECDVSSDPAKAAFEIVGLRQEISDAVNLLEEATNWLANNDDHQAGLYQRIVSFLEKHTHSDAEA
jgi:hypothetical protein